jgi:DNA replication protein DnaC
MENLNQILNRESLVNEIKEILQNFDANCKNINFKKGIYLYGSPGSGKTHFIMNILREMNYPVQILDYIQTYE